MANTRNVQQCVNTISIPRNALLNIARTEDYSKKELRVFMLLLTQLSGWSPAKNKLLDYNDPSNFKQIDIESIAESLCMEKKEVKKCIKKLKKFGILETGDSDTVKNGYRFTF